MNYLKLNCNLSFTEYIQQSQSLIRSRRTFNDAALCEKIVSANSPFEIKSSHAAPSTGLLFMHGLLDSPFSMHELATRCAAPHRLCRGILSPGHGTQPHDLLHVTYTDWIAAMEYGVQSLLQEVDRIFLVGYSTGGLLSLHHTAYHEKIAGLILIAPAIKIKFPSDPLFRLIPYLYCSKTEYWIKKTTENDYAKYRSIPYHAVSQLSQLITFTADKQKISCPLLIITSSNDETISSHAAIELFKKNNRPENKLLVFTKHPDNTTDHRIIMRTSYFPDHHINHFSHRSLLFSPTNPHYGKKGDFELASHPNPDKYYGAYIGWLGKYYDLLHTLHLTNMTRQELTYNPDFDFLGDTVVKFISDIENK